VRTKEKEKIRFLPFCPVGGCEFSEGGYGIPFMSTLKGKKAGSIRMPAYALKRRSTFHQYPRGEKRGPNAGMACDRFDYQRREEQNAPFCITTGSGRVPRHVRRARKGLGRWERKKTKSTHHCPDAHVALEGKGGGEGGRRERRETRAGRGETTKAKEAFLPAHFREEKTRNSERVRNASQGSSGNQ